MNHRVEQRLDALVAAGRSEEHRHCLAAQGRTTQRGANVGRGERLALEVLGHDLVVHVRQGLQEIVTHAESKSFKTLLEWCSSFKGIDVLANADLAGAVRRSVEFGASGVGLVRTEHMFFGERRKILQAAILSLGEDAYRQCLAELAGFQRQDFEAIFESAQGKQWQMVRSGSSYASQSDLTLTFGLGADAAPVTIDVEWPSGARDQIAGVTPRQILTVEEGRSK